jgi:hypothetical protein
MAIAMTMMVPMISPGRWAPNSQMSPAIIRIIRRPIPPGTRMKGFL